MGSSTEPAVEGYGTVSLEVCPLDGDRAEMMEIVEEGDDCCINWDECGARVPSP